MRAISDLMMSLSSLTENNVHSIRKTTESPPRISVIDVISLVTGHNQQQAATTTQRLLEAYPEVSTSVTHFRFSGRGQRDTPVSDVYGICDLVMVLPGKAAGRVRRQAANVLCRYLGGDLSMVDEIAKNRDIQHDLDEDAPARIFGQSLPSDAVTRKREEVTLAELEVTLAELEGARKRRRIESCKYCLEAMADDADDRDRLRVADMVRSIAFGSASSTDPPPADNEICIREVINAAGRAREVGLDCKVGKLAKKLYLAEHPGFIFPKKQIYANGQLLECNMWQSSQRGVIELALSQL